MKNLTILFVVIFALFVNSVNAENKKEVKKDTKKTETVKADAKKDAVKAEVKKDTKKDKATAEKCQGKTKAGEPCKRNAAKDSKYCFQHGEKKADAKKDIKKADEKKEAKKK